MSSKGKQKNLQKLQILLDKRNAEKEATQILWLFANALIGIIVAIDFFTGKVSAMLRNILFFAGYAFGLWAIYVVFGGILEFGAYATVILFFVICIPFKFV